MKRTILTISLILVSLIGIAQFSFDSTGYKAYIATISSKTQFSEGASDVLFFFTKTSMTNTLPASNQSSTLRFDLKNLKETNIAGTQTLYLPCIDKGGFACELYIGYYAKTDVYSIIIKYNNVLFFFECRTTIERPWDNDPKDIKAFEPWDGTYTDEEIDAFFKQFGINTVDKKAVTTTLYNLYLQQ